MFTNLKVGTSAKKAKAYFRRVPFSSSACLWLLISAALHAQPIAAMPPDTAAAPRLLYVYDALCGWCYGFSPVLGELHARHPELPLEVVSGGMIRGERRGPIGEVASYIKWAYRDVEQRTGVEFGAGFVEGPLERGDMYMTSEPPAKLLAYVREVAPRRAYDAAHALQRGIYFHGYGPGSPELARHLADELDLDPGATVAALDELRYERLAEADFDLTGRLGVRGFPALLLVRGDSAQMLTNGYADLATVERRLAGALAPADAQN